MSKSKPYIMKIRLSYESWNRLQLDAKSLGFEDVASYVRHSVFGVNPVFIEQKLVKIERLLQSLLEVHNG